MVSGSRPSARASACRAHPAPPGNLGSLRKMQAPSTTRVAVVSSSGTCQPSRVPTACCCQTEASSRSTARPTRSRSSASVRWAPSVQHPASGRVASMPRHPWPNRQCQREVNQVRSALTRCAGSAGSTNSTHARGASSGVSVTPPG
ncbi:hypothetical protein [Ornithinimicrobium kibberense]|uniref:hypothetical protein n=1 Tax=Ornithinimicrobium kibberense TaxID=282060 RepID=UPI00361C957D